MTTNTTRRTFVRALGGAAVGGAALSGTAAGAEGTDLSGWLSDVSNATEVVDRRGQDEVEIEVGAEANGGAFGFGPAVVRVDPGTTVVWTWVAGRHNVVHTDGKFKSKYHSDSGATFEFAAESAGVYKYYCTPHKTMGMKGALVVGDEPVSIGTETTTAPETTTTASGGDGESYEGGRFDGWLADAPNYEGDVADRRGEDEVVIEVQNGEFSPPAVHVDSGTTVVWEWATGEGSHSVVDSDGGYSSDPLSGEDSRYAVQFDGHGLSKYECDAQGDTGMRGVVLVGNGPGTMTRTAATGLGVTALAGALVLGKGVLVHLEQTTGGDDD